MYVVDNTLNDLRKNSMIYMIKNLFEDQLAVFQFNSINRGLYFLDTNGHVYVYRLI
jgi:hypothetical protein